MLEERSGHYLDLQESKVSNDNCATRTTEIQFANIRLVSEGEGKKLDCTDVLNLEARFISRQPFRFKRTGTRMKSSCTRTKAGQNWTWSNTNPVITEPTIAQRREGVDWVTSSKAVRRFELRTAMVGLKCAGERSPAVST